MCARGWGEQRGGLCNVQGKGAEDDLEGVDGKDVCNAQGKAENHGQDPEPGEHIMLAEVLQRCRRRGLAAVGIVFGRWVRRALAWPGVLAAQRGANREGSLPLSVDT